MASSNVASALMRALPRPWKEALGERDRSRFVEWIPRGVSRDGLVFFQHVREGKFQRSLALVAGASAVLAGLEVSYEHYRGSYSQRKMYTPVALTPPLVIAGIWCVFDKRAARHALPLISLLTIADGALGFVFHVRGIARKPGGFRIPMVNIVMGPPIFAPLLFAIPGYLGLIASFLRRSDDPGGRHLPFFARRRSWWQRLLPAKLSRDGLSIANEVREGRFQKQMAGAAAAASLFSGFEALYSHYKTNFRYKAQWTPVIIAPLLTAAGVAAIWNRRAARTLLPIASSLAIADGAAGFFYHARGVARRPGGLSTPVQNLMYGPPIFAPLLFAAAGFLGLLASLLRRER